MARYNALSWLAPLALLAGSAQAQFTDNTADIPGGSPGNNSNTENVDFADVDLDGDWDAVFADGGDDGNDQNRIWINQGGDQGGTVGVFLDRTSTQFPSVSDTSRDIEFVDLDRDGDPDIYVSNTSTSSSQSNRWWINQGGDQGGTAGFFLDDSANRWVGLGEAGSSINPGFVIGNGFVDWSCDCDFGDLDNDGDLDLVHSSYGGNFEGQVPTRIFLNDGTGKYSEFNPSGEQVGAQGTIEPGDDGIWCDGTFSQNTTNTTGASCDIATTGLDIDLGDIDRDYDLDILHGARNNVPRMFANRLEGTSLAPDNGGLLGFRDVTGMVFPANYSTGGGNYEQEMADCDGDGDLDIYGLNWGGGGGSGLSDTTMRNTGSGIFTDITVLDGSGADDNEGDFLDYDNDGDLDLFVANFSGQDKLYRNNNDGGATFDYTNVTSGNVPFLSAIALDADACDVDNDGDYDIFVANDNFTRNYYYENGDDTPDTSAPYIPNVERADNRTPGPDPTVIRAQVYDNAPYYITWYNPTSLEYTVNSGTPVTVPMQTSGGQIFRGEIPGELQGFIEYRVISEDEYGNEGSSVTLNYSADGLGTRFCNPAVPNSTGQGGQMIVTGSDVVADDDLLLIALDLPRGNNIGYFIMGMGMNTFTPPGSAGPICVAPGIKRYLPPVNMTSELGGGFSRDVGTQGPVSGDITVGSTWNFQAWHRDGMNPSNLTDAVSVTFQ